MISLTRLGSYGRLGNQMFQYACAYSVATKNNTKISINTSDFHRNSDINQLVETFELKSSVFNRFENIKYVFQEASYDYDPRILQVLNETDLVGYFQSEKYFKHLKQDLIKNELCFKPEIEENAKKILRNIDNNDNLCSIHIRLGDYKNLSETHNNLKEDYYKKSIELISNCSNYLVFSDEPREAEKIIKNLATQRSNLILAPDVDYNVCLCLMTMCKHHIIANSSFSWWGAWLSRQNGQVIAPKDWFGPKGPKSWNDVYCESWKII